MRKNKKLEHIAMILDGNGRWATAKNKPRIHGHEQGFKQFKPIILTAIEQDIKYLTLYCFSTENWNRPKHEVKFLMNIPVVFVKNNEFEFLMTNGIKIKHLGRKSQMPNQTRKALAYLEKLTEKNDKILVNIAFDYGSFEEIISAIKKMHEDNVIDDNLNEELLLSYLYTKNQPLIDLVIRSGGEKRLSNFLLLQAGYAEMYFTEIL